MREHRTAVAAYRAGDRNRTVVCWELRIRRLLARTARELEPPLKRPPLNAPTTGPLSPSAPERSGAVQAEPVRMTA